MKSNWEKRILHLGLGRFHRGHQAVYFQRMAEHDDCRWGVVSCSMRSPEARDEMRTTNYKYPVLELSEKNLGVIWVESIREALDVQSDFDQVMTYFEDSKIEIISLTITEKGYCLTSSGKLDQDHPQIQQDLKSPERPRTAIGIVVLGLKKRMEQNSASVTIVSCDNLRENGTKLESALTTYLEQLKWNDVLDWMKKNVSFPNTMVDRIVPALTPEKMTEFESRFGLKTHSHLIATEEFSQWVIEDKFKRERPPWEKVGVQFVNDVRPYEEMKLRLLNASHSFLAYLGLLKGYQFVHEAVGDESLQAKVELLMLREVVPLLDIPTDFNVVQYEESLISRFKNSQLPHQLKQIAMDGSQKLPQRIMPSLTMAHKKNSSKEMLITTISAWLNYCWKIINDNPNELSDPMRETFEKIDRSDRFSWSKAMLNTAPFESISQREDLKNIIIQKASTHSLDL
jgi:fructuronate reductase